MFRCHLSGAYPPPPAFYLSKHASPIVNAAKLRSVKLTIFSQDKSLSLTGLSGPRLCLQMLNTLDSTPGRGRGVPSLRSLSRPRAPTSGSHSAGPSSQPRSKAHGPQGPLTTSLLLEKHQLFLKQSTSLSSRKSILVKARGLPPGPSSGSLSRLFLAVPFSTPAMEREEASVSLGRRCDLMAPRPRGPCEAQVPSRVCHPGSC